MHKKITLASLVVCVFAIAGCGNKAPESNLLPSPEAQEKAAMQEQVKQSALENSAPKTTNDLPTAIDETEKDLQMIDNDLKEIDKLNLDENDTEL